MNKITKDNLDEFINYYHEFHDSYITNVNYDISKSQIELLINVRWAGKPILREDKTYQTNKIKMRMILNNIEQCNNKEMFFIPLCDPGFPFSLNLKAENGISLSS